MLGQSSSCSCLTCTGTDIITSRSNNYMYLSVNQTNGDGGEDDEDDTAVVAAVVKYFDRESVSGTTKYQKW